MAGPNFPLKVTGAAGCVLGAAGGQVLRQVNAGLVLSPEPRTLPLPPDSSMKTDPSGSPVVRANAYVDGPTSAVWSRVQLPSTREPPAVMVPLPPTTRK